MRSRTKQIVAAAWVAVSVSGLAMAQPAPGDAPPPPPVPAEPAASAEPVAIKGTVAGLNFGPGGEANGLMLKTGDGPLTQVNFPPHMADAIAKVAKDGAGVSVTTRPLPPRPMPPRPPRPDGPDAADHPTDRPAPPPAPKPPAPADHPVVELVSLTPDGGAELKVVRPDEMPLRHVEGKVARLNYAREGQVDGAVLEDGTFVHTGPRAAATLKLAVGLAVTADGATPPRATGKVLEAKTVNGTTIDRPRPRPDRGPDAPPPAPAPQ